MLCALIVAGGTGKRFWPISTDEKPKQLLKLLSDKTIIQETVDRILPLISAESVYIVTNNVQAEAIKEQLPMISDKNIIIEPDAKDTAAAIGYGSLFISRHVENATIVVLPSDHVIKNNDLFLELLRKAQKEAENHQSIVTFGIKPTRPEIGYGYIKCNHYTSDGSVCQIEEFLEKPNQARAKAFIDEGSYLWNSGIFVFTARTIAEEIEHYMPKHHRILKNIAYYVDKGMVGLELCHKTEILFEDFEKISIDYGIMEKTKNIKVIPCDIGWSDIGSFTAFSDIYPVDENNNVIRDSNYTGINSTGNIILTEDLEVRVVGLTDYIVVQHQGKLLICNKFQVDDMKKLFDES